MTLSDLCAKVREARESSGLSRSQAAVDLSVTRSAIFAAEERPERKLFKLRRAIMERYSPFTLEILKTTEYKLKPKTK